MSLLKNASVMLIGFAVAQAVPLLAAPILTRIYTPEAFGLQTLFMGIGTALIVIATLRLDLALVIADDDERPELAGSIVILSGTVLVILALVMLLFGSTFAVRSGHPGAELWLWLLPVLVFAAVLTQIATSQATLGRRYGSIVAANVANQVAYVAGGLLFAAPLGVQGLAAAKATGQLVGTAFLGRSLAGSTAIRFRVPDRARLAHLWARFHQFVLFNAPYSLVGTIAREMPIYVFGVFTATAAAGFYGLARMLLGIPNLLASAALSQVFFREAVELKGTARLEQTTVSLLTVTFLAPAPLFAFVCVWGDVLFHFVFGDRWFEAGVYAMILAVPAWLGLQTGWPERLFEVMMRQDLSFRVQMLFDALTVVAVAAPMVLGYDPVYAVIGFAVINSLYQLVYLGAMFRAARFSTQSLRRILVEGIAGLGLSLAIFAVLRALPLQPVVAGAGCAVLASLAALALLIWRGRGMLKLIGRTGTNS